MSKKWHKAYEKRAYRNYSSDTAKTRHRPDVKYESDSLLTKNVRELGSAYAPDERKLRYEPESSDKPSVEPVDEWGSKANPLSNNEVKPQPTRESKPDIKVENPRRHDDQRQSVKSDESTRVENKREQAQSYRFSQRKTPLREEKVSSAADLAHQSSKAKTDSTKKQIRSRLDHGDESNSMIRGAGGFVRRTVSVTEQPAKRYLRHEIEQADKDNAAIDSIKSGAEGMRMLNNSKRHENMGSGQYTKAANVNHKTEHAAQTEKQKKDRIKAFNRKKQNKETVRKRHNGESEGFSGVTDAIKRVFSKSGGKGNGGGNSNSSGKGGKILLIAGGGVLLLILLLFGGSAVLLQGGGSPIVETTYASSDSEIYAAENEMCRLEDSLNAQINNFEKTHPGYDEYEYQVDEIEHNPYALISYLEAKYGAFTCGDNIKAEIGRLFKAQYMLSVSERTEKRTRMETVKATRQVYDEKTQKWKTQEYETQQEVEYEYRICYCTLTNRGFETVAQGQLDEGSSFRYNLLTATMGNRVYLFDTSLSGTAASVGKKYQIPPEALSDAKFANMIREAEKYLGMPYVAGGKSVRTGFDCSGFVCWVLNHCGNGWNVGQRRAKDLCSMCRRISPAEAKPGDLIFFEKTYNTTGASHVGIYVGNGMMIHCGNPIKYSSVNTRYFKEHFLCFGRLPFNN